MKNLSLTATVTAALIFAPSALAGGGAPLVVTPAATVAAPAAQNTVTYYPSSGTLPFSEAVEVGNTLYMSGQLGLDASGKLVPGGVQAETRQALANIEDVLKEHGYTKRNLVKCMVMLTDMNNFGAMNEVYGAWMVKPYPVRSAFGVSGLALGGSVEIECVAAK